MEIRDNKTVPLPIILATIPTEFTDCFGPYSPDAAAAMHYQFSGGYPPAPHGKTHIYPLRSMRELMFFLLRYLWIVRSNVSISKSNDDDVSRWLSCFIKSEYHDGSHGSSSSSSTRIIRCYKWRSLTLI